MKCGADGKSHNSPQNKIMHSEKTEVMYLWYNSKTFVLGEGGWRGVCNPLYTDLHIERLIAQNEI